MVSLSPNPIIWARFNIGADRQYLAVLNRAGWGWTVLDRAGQGRAIGQSNYEIS